MNSFPVAGLEQLQRPECPRQVGKRAEDKESLKAFWCNFKEVEYKVVRTVEPQNRWRVIGRNRRGDARTSPVS